MTEDEYELTPSEEYAEAFRNWDKVHNKYRKGEATLEEEIEAWDRRRACERKMAQMREEEIRARTEGRA